MSTIDRRFDDIEELLAAYALDAVDDDERRLVEAYLETDARARAEVDQYREVATWLAVTGGDAPEGLWDRIASTLAGRPEDAPAPGPELTKVLPIGGRPRRRRLWLIGLAAAVVAVVAAVSVAVFRDNGPSSSVAAAYDSARANPANKTVTLATPEGAPHATAVIEPSGTAFLDASALPALGADRTYQLWAVLDNGQPISLGILGPQPQITMFGVSGAVAALAITDEKAGGAVAPEQAPKIVGTLR